MPVYRSLRVVPVDGSGNSVLNDVVGNKNDTYAGTSVVASLQKLREYFFSQGKTYPEAANPIAVTTSGTAWTLSGTTTQVIPVNGVTSDFIIHHVVICGISANGCYELVLYKGGIGSEEEIARIGFSRNAVKSQEGSMPVIMELQEADERISVELLSSNNAANSCNVKFMYHEYS